MILKVQIRLHCIQSYKWILYFLLFPSPYFSTKSFLFNICSDNNLINSNFLSCNFNLSATSWTLNSSSGVLGNNNLDLD